MENTLFFAAQKRHSNKPHTNQTHSSSGALNTSGAPPTSTPKIINNKKKNNTPQTEQKQSPEQPKTGLNPPNHIFQHQGCYQYRCIFDASSNHCNRSILPPASLQTGHNPPDHQDTRPARSTDEILSNQQGRERPLASILLKVP